jgi:hypothetical protein
MKIKSKTNIHDLTYGKEYEVLEIHEEGYYKIINDKGEEVYKIKYLFE